MNKRLKTLFLLSLLIFVDQFSKFLAGKLGLEISLNNGISLGFLANFSSIGLILFNLIFLMLIFVLFRENWLTNPIISILFFSGSISNIIDRIIYGAVRDWLKIPFFEIYNNLADWFIFVGLVLFLVSQISVSKHEAQR